MTFSTYHLSLFGLLLLLLALAAPAGAEQLTDIRLGYYPDKIRIVLDFDATFTYSLDESKEKIIINLPKVEASSDIQNYLEVSDLLIRYLEIERIDNGLKISIPLTEPIPYNIFYLNDPARLIIDFNRDFTNLLSGGTVIDGVEWLKASKGSLNGRITANILKIDLNKAEVSPALARKDKPSLFDSFVNIFNPWKAAGSGKHFFRARVSTIAEEQGAVAAINGTYFAYTGKPLGTLLVNKELVATPIHDRTALILTDDHQAIIDNIILDCYFRAPNGVRYDITGVNQGRDPKGIVLYTPAWGEKTGTGLDGLELVVIGNVVQEVKLGNSVIPPDGYIISLRGPLVQFLADNVKAGDKLDVHIKIIPFSSSPGTINDLISGGPRLVKNGIVYISKHEEQFKADIARGRAARTAVGVTRENKLLLVTVDGLPRQKEARTDKSSIGMTLEELAEFMINLGAVEAMNLDGGGSTTMWIDGRVVNRPANGEETAVSNALIVRPR